MSIALSPKFLEHQEKLHYMLENNYPYEEIVKQSQALDKYVLEEMKKINTIKKPIE